MADPFGTNQDGALGAADWSLYFKNPPLAPKDNAGWYRGIASPIYGALGSNKNPYSYDPAGSSKSYDPYSTYSAQAIAGDIQNYMRWNESDWMAWTGTVNANVGLVAQDPTYGQFSKDPAVYGEIQAAAQKYGVPANFLQVILAREGSGDWATNNAKGSFFVPSRNDSLTPYTGVFKAAADQRVGPGLYEKSIGNRALQIEILAGVLRSQYDELQKRNPQWGWTNVAAYHYSGDPTGGTTPADSTQYYETSDYVAKTEQEWKALDAISGNTWSNYTTSAGNVAGGGTAMGSPSAQKWTMVNQWNSQISAAIQKVQQETGVAVPGNVVKAIMMIESGGDPNVGVSPAGYGGLMQTGPGSMGGPWTMQQLQDPAFAIYTGVKELALRYLDSGKMPWGNVAVGYFSGHYQPNGASDGFNSDYNYQSMFNSNLAELNASGSGTFGGMPTGGGGVNVGAVFGGTIPGKSQSNGEINEWTLANPGMYAYGKGLGIEGGGHPGNDYGVAYGTQVYSGVSGTVFSIGSEGGYADDSGGPGAIRIRLANGDELIYGHMSGSSVTVGQVVKVGDPIGRTGTAGSGAHLHLELRVVDPSTPDGFRSVNPEDGISGAGGVTGQYVQTGPGYTLPLTYHNILMGIMTGRTLPYGNNGTFGTASDNPFRNHLLSIMNGTYNQNNSLSRAQALGYVGRNSVMGAAQNGAGGAFSTTNVSNAKLTKTGEQIVSLAKGYLGTPYVWAGHTPTGWDCSGFAGWFYQNYLGIDIGYGSHYQYNMGQAVDKSQLQVGDLVFFDTAGGSEVDAGNTASHVGMYIGNGQMIHAANPSEGTIITSLNSPYYSGTYIGARRYA